MSSVLRARTIGETRGFMKALMDSRSDRILGFTMLGSGEAIAAVQSAMLGGLRDTGLRDAILTHPTIAEGLNVMLAGVPAVTEATRAHAARGGSPRIRGRCSKADRRAAFWRRRPDPRGRLASFEVRELGGLGDEAWISTGKPAHTVCDARRSP